MHPSESDDKKVENENVYFYHLCMVINNELLVESPLISPLSYLYLLLV